MELIDTHCHLDFDAYDDDREAVIERCRDEMAAVVNIGTNQERNTASLDLARQHDVVSATMGLHPTYITDTDRAEVDAITAQIRQNSDDIVAIGEIGLDYHHVREEHLREQQEDWFRRFMDLAAEVGLPAVLHTRDAEKRALEVIADYEVPIIQHCFNGAPALAEECVDRGYYVSISTQVLYSERVQTIAETVPLEHILLETDAPFLYQGKRNVPWHVKESAEQIAAIKDIDVTEVAARTSTNARDVLNL